MRRLLFLLPFPGVLMAQAPQITPAGDPSVRDDSIYALAVDPADHPDDDWIYLLDDGVVRVEKDGRTTRTYRYVVQVLSREAAEQWGERSYGFDPGRERLTINWVRVLRPDGTVLSSQPVHEQESTAPVAQQAPVYSDRRIRRLSLGGVAPNTIVDYSYTTETLHPVVVGDFSLDWSVTTGRLTRRSRYIVDLPADLSPRIIERNVRFPRHTTERGGRRVHVWGTAEVPEGVPEPFAAWPNEVDVSIHLSGPIRWAAIGRWYAELARDRDVLTDTLEQLLEGLVAGAETYPDSLSAVHRWVAQDFRYVSLSLGIGGYQPRTPAAVLETRYGDCKDKATLFVALARHLGWEAFPVLTSATGTIDTTLPSIHQFDHMIAAVRRDGAWQYLDLTADLVPLGQLPPQLQGEFGLVVFRDGQSEGVMLPEPAPEAHWSRSRVTGTIDTTGNFTGSYEETAAGNAQYGLRGTFAEPAAPEDRERVARVLANNLFEGAVGDSLEVFDGRDLTAAPRIALRVRNGRLTPGGRGTWVLNLPLQNFSSLGLVNELEARRPRRYPIDVEGVAGPMRRTWEMTITLPAGWEARLPDDVHAVSRYGEYTASYVQDGRELRVTRRLAGRTGTEPPEAVDALIAWLRELSRDDVRFVILDASP